MQSVRPGKLPFCYTSAYLWLITPSAFNIWIDLSFLDTTGKLPVILPLGSNHFHHQALFSYSENFQRCSNNGSIFIFSSLAQRWHFLNWPETKKFQLSSSDIHGKKKKSLAFTKKVFCICIALKKLIFKFSFCNPQWKWIDWLIFFFKLFGNNRHKHLIVSQSAHVSFWGDRR